MLIVRLVAYASDKKTFLAYKINIPLCPTMALKKKTDTTILLYAYPRNDQGGLL